jgi:hypothetical protein
MTNPLSSRDLLVLMEMCLDAEDRCAERALVARQRGDFAAADRELKLQERYSRLRYSVFRQMDLPKPAGAREAGHPAPARPQLVHSASG